MYKINKYHYFKRCSDFVLFSSGIVQFACDSDIVKFHSDQ